MFVVPVHSTNRLENEPPPVYTAIDMLSLEQFSTENLMQQSNTNQIQNGVFLSDQMGLDNNRIRSNIPSNSSNEFFESLRPNLIDVSSDDTNNLIGNTSEDLTLENESENENDVELSLRNSEHLRHQELRLKENLNENLSLSEHFRLNENLSLNGNLRENDHLRQHEHLRQNDHLRQNENLRQTEHLRQNEHLRPNEPLRQNERINPSSSEDTIQSRFEPAPHSTRTNKRNNKQTILQNSRSQTRQELPFDQFENR